MNDRATSLYYLANTAIETLQRAYQDCPHAATEELILSALKTVRKLQQDIQGAGTL